MSRTSRRAERRREAGRTAAESWTQGWRIHFSAVLLLALAAYGNSLGAGFVFDDNAMLSDARVTGAGAGAEILRLEQTRPLTYLTFHWNFLAGGVDPWGYHAVNVALHAGNSALVLAVARHVLPPPAALVAAAVFAVHPLQSESVSYIFQRATLLAALFALLSLHLFLQERLAWSAAAFAMSLLAKEETMALPALLLLFEQTLRGRRAIRPAYYAAMFALSGAAAGRLFYALHRASQPTLGFQLKGVSAVSYLLTQARVIWRYLGLFVWPSGQNLDHDMAVSQSLTSPPSTLVAVISLLVLLCGLCWLAWRGKHAASLWALGFFVLLSPSSSVVPAADVMFEHRTYFPLVSLVVAAGALWRLLPARWAGGAAIAVLAILLSAAMARNGVWKNSVTLWTDVVEKSPGKVRGYLNLAMAYSRSEPGRSRQLAERAVEIAPEHADARTMLGVILMVQGEPANGLKQFERALSLRGETAAERNNLGMARTRIGQRPQAEVEFRRALALEPCFPAARFNLVSVLAELGNRGEALREAEAPAGCRFTEADSQTLGSLRGRL